MIQLWACGFGCVLNVKVIVCFLFTLFVAPVPNNLFLGAVCKSACLLTYNTDIVVVSVHVTVIDVAVFWLLAFGCKGNNFPSFISRLKMQKIMRSSY